jgi:hypothetical protein
MELSKISSGIAAKEDFNSGFKAVQALHYYPSDVAVPILLDQMIDRQFWCGRLLRWRWRSINRSEFTRCWR